MALRFVDASNVAAWLTPAGDDPQKAELTAWSGPDGYVAYARVLALPEPEGDGQPPARLAPDLREQAPSDIQLVTDCITALKPHSTTPDDLFILLWTGYPYSPRLPITTPVSFVAIREYVVARGSIDAWSAWLADVDGSRGFPPAFIWPADKSWCFSYDVGAHFAGIAGCEVAVSALVAAKQHNARLCSRATPTKRYT